LQYLALSFVLCLACSALGFIRTVNFVGVGYAASIAAQSVAAAILYAANLSGWPLVQVLLLCAYGIRLGSYLTLRDRDRGYQDHQSPMGARRSPPGAMAKIAIWVGVSTLYVLMALPAFLTLSAQAHGLPLGSLPAGVVLMSLGLGLETVADWQKFRFKAGAPTLLCKTGLYQLVRCPNYLGEMVFWSGLWLSALSAYQGWLEWSLSTLGLASILGIMIGATRRLEGEQERHYAAARHAESGHSTRLCSGCHGLPWHEGCGSAAVTRT
jgi:steroid 5-alpha reductase family enzyme